MPTPRREIPRRAAWRSASDLPLLMGFFSRDAASVGFSEESTWLKLMGIQSQKASRDFTGDWLEEVA